MQAWTGGGVWMTDRLTCPPAPGPLEDYATKFDGLFATLAQRRGFREYLQGLLLPRARNKTLTALVGAEPIVGADAAPVQKLQFFLPRRGLRGVVSESTWQPDVVNDQRLELLLSDPATKPHEAGVLVIDETGDRKDGNKTAHIARQYLGSLGKTDNGIVSVSSLWADERIYYPLHVEPYTPGERLPQGKKDPAFQTKPQIALELVAKALGIGVAFRAVVADCFYGDNPTFEGTLSSAGLPFVLGVKPSKGFWAPVEAIHTPQEAARALRWGGQDDPSGDWTKVVRRFRDDHEQTWWAADLSLGGYGPDKPFRLVVATTDPEELPALSTWYLMTNLARPGSPQADQSEFAPADLAEIVWLYGLRNWVEQGYKQVKHELGWADFMVRSDLAIRRHWALVQCAFSFCWQAWFKADQGSESVPVEPGQPVPGEASDPEVEMESPAPPTEEEAWRWGKNEGQAREATESAATLAKLADGAAASPRLADSLGYALALVAGVVRFAPATRAPGSSALGRQRPPPQSLSPNLTKYR
jgi:SRSO17 transposase